MAFLAVSAIAITSSNAALIAYWDQNSNALPSGGFGFTPASFPQAADQGSGALTLANFVTTTSGVDNAYTTIQSFVGDTLNAQPMIGSGGSLSPQGGSGLGNNGMSIILQVNTIGFTDLTVSWAQRGTATGFNSRQFDYSLDNANWTNVGTDIGALSATWETESYNLTGITALEGQSNVYFRIVLAGSSSTSGNNRFDNILVEGTQTVIPEPSTALLGAIGALMLLRRRR